MRGGWLQSPEALHPAEIPAAERGPAAAQEWGYAAKAPAACSETASEAWRGRSRLRKQTDASLDSPSVTETAEALPCTAGTDGPTMVVGHRAGCSRVSCCLPQHALDGGIKALLLRLPGLILPFLHLFVHPSNPAGLGGVAGGLVKDLLNTKSSSSPWETSPYSSDEASCVKCLC